MLVIFAGLPGVGKTTLSRLVAERLGACYLRIDSIEGALAASVLKIHPAEDAGYRVGYAVAEDNLRLGRTVVADSVNPVEETRAAWRAIAERVGCQAVEIEVVCSDREEHRRRVEQRLAAAPGQRLPGWQDVVDRDYRVWARDRLVVDTTGRSIEESVRQVLEVLAADGD